MLWGRLPFVHYHLGMVLNVTIFLHGTTVTISLSQLPTLIPVPNVILLCLTTFMVPNVIIITGLILVMVPNAFPDCLSIFSVPTLCLKDPQIGNDTVHPELLTLSRCLIQIYYLIFRLHTVAWEVKSVRVYEQRHKETARPTFHLNFWQLTTFQNLLIFIYLNSGYQ